MLISVLFIVLLHKDLLDVLFLLLLKPKVIDGFRLLLLFNERDFILFDARIILFVVIPLHVSTFRLFEDFFLIIIGGSCLLLLKGFLIFCIKGL